MALVNRENSITFLFPSKLSSTRRIHRSTGSTSSESSTSSYPSTYSFTRTSQESSQESTACCSTTFLGPSQTRTSCLSEFCCNCGNYNCTLSRRAHLRRKSKPRLIRPLPQIPTRPVRALPRPTGVRKLPLVPYRPQYASQRPQRSSLLDRLASSETESLSYGPPSLLWDPDFTPEIDWDTIMVEIVRENGIEESSDYYDYSDDAESIYTNFVYDE